MFYSKTLRKIVRAYPGKRYFAEYRFLPIFFIGGAAVEYLMIHWYAGKEQVNFYKTYKKRKVDEIIWQKEQQKLIKSGELKFQVSH